MSLIHHEMETNKKPVGEGCKIKKEDGQLAQGGFWKREMGN